MVEAELAGRLEDGPPLALRLQEAATSERRLQVASRGWVLPWSLWKARSPADICTSYFWVQNHRWEN